VDTFPIRKTLINGNTKYLVLFMTLYFVIKGEYLVKNTTDIRIDVIFYD